MLLKLKKKENLEGDELLFHYCYAIYIWDLLEKDFNNLPSVVDVTISHIPFFLAFTNFTSLFYFFYKNQPSRSSHVKTEFSSKPKLIYVQNDSEECFI